MRLLDQAEFLQPLAQKQCDRSPFGNSTKGYLFVVGELRLLEASGCEFHRVPSWRPGLDRESSGAWKNWFPAQITKKMDAVAAQMSPVELRRAKAMIDRCHVSNLKTCD